MTDSTSYDPPVRALYADLSEKAHSGWVMLARSHGATISSILEVIGARLADNPEIVFSPPDEWTPEQQDLAREIQRVATLRRRRSTSRSAPSSA